ncbi:MAG: HAD family hydrolase [Bacilli bacterium]
MVTILWDLDGTIQDSESLAKEGTRHGFRKVLGRDPTEDEFAQLIGKPVPMVYREWFGDELGRQILDIGSHYYKEQAINIHCYDGVSELLFELNRTGYRMGIVSSKRHIWERTRRCVIYRNSSERTEGGQS